MLGLTRRIGESVLIGKDIKITVIKTTRGQVRLQISAPKEIKILREELVSKDA